MAFCQTFRLSVSLLYFWRLRCILLSKTPSKPDVQIWKLLRNQDLLLLWRLRESEWLARTKSLHWCQNIQKMSGGVNNCSDQQEFNNVFKMMVWNILFYCTLVKQLLNSQFRIQSLSIYVQSFVLLTNFLMIYGRYCRCIMVPHLKWTDIWIL